MTRVATNNNSWVLAMAEWQNQIRRYLGLGLLCAGFTAISFPGTAGTVNAPVTARIVSTVNLITLSGLEFGEISASSSPGTIVLEPGGARTSTQGATLNTAVPGGPASFEVIGDPSATYIITLPVSVTLSSTNGQSMEVNQFTSLPSGTGRLDAGGRQTLFIGGTLNVDANQLYGDYSGIMTVNVEYN